MAGLDPATHTNGTARLDGWLLAGHGEREEFPDNDKVAGYPL
jgi:hypothetical protein